MSVMVSIILPCFNAEKYIDKTIESIFSQSYENYELIIVDDKSTDDTYKKIQGYLKLAKVHYICLEKNSGGPAKPRNTGMMAAKGKYIAFIDGDDIWHPRKLEIQLQQIMNTQAEFCSASMLDFSGSPHIFNDTEIQTEKLDFRRMLKKGIIPTSSVVLKRQLTEGLYFNENVEYKGVEDYEFWLKVHEKIEFSIKIKSPFLVAYRNEGQGISSSKFSQARKIWMLHKKYRINGHTPLSFFNRLYLYAHYFMGSVYFRIIKKKL